MLNQNSLGNSHLAGSSIGGHRGSELLYVFLRKNNINTLWSKEIQEFPVDRPYLPRPSLLPDKEYSNYGDRAFGANCNGNFVVGYHCFNSDPFNPESLILYQFNLQANSWNRIMKTKKFPKMCSSIRPHRNNEHSGCLISDSCFVLLDESVKLLHLNFCSSNNDRKEILNDLSWNNCETKLNFTPYGYTMTRVDSNSAVLVGGIDIDSDLEGNPIQFLWKATLNEHENDITWSQMKEELPVKRRNPICFIIKDNLYIAGGYTAVWSDQEMKPLLSCDRYNLTEEKFYSTKFCLPHHFDGANVSTAAKEDFAVILFGHNLRGNNSQKVTIFTEDDGFKDILYDSTSNTSAFIGRHCEIMLRVL